MRKLAIRIFDEQNRLQEQFICDHMDAVSSHTVLYNIQKKDEIYLRQCIPEKIDHWNLMEGLITIYYESGFTMEISRIYD